jgi:hypothetical protein
MAPEHNLASPAFDLGIVGEVDNNGRGGAFVLDREQIAASGLDDSFDFRLLAIRDLLYGCNRKCYSCEQDGAGC